MEHKIIFQTGYQVKNIFNDNIDIQVILSNGEVFFGTVFTIENIQYLMSKEPHCNYFWSTDMVIVKNLEIDTIRKAISEIIVDGYLEDIFTKIGDIKQVYSIDMTFDQLEGV